MYKFLAALSIAGTFTLSAEEGMWTFNNIPVQAIEKQYNVQLTPEWLLHVQKSCLRVSLGGSASFVSPQGLFMTNHHVGSTAIYHLSNKDKNLMDEGFLAKTFEEELKCPNMYVDQLISIQDVTGEVNEKTDGIESPIEREKLRQAAIARVKEKAKLETGLQPEVVLLYQGARYHLYLYQRYSDIRLVMSPEKCISFFGGDHDNFEYPRYDLDVSFFRVYQDGKPLDSNDYLKWSKEGPKLLEPLFVVGHPGKTRRMLTSAHLQFLYDNELSIFAKWLKTRQSKLQEFGGFSAENRRICEQDLFSIENTLKVMNNVTETLGGSSLIRDKRAEEDAFIENTESNPWLKLEKALDDAKLYYSQYIVLEGLGSNYSKLYSWAKTLLRLSVEKQKPNELRLREYTDSEMAQIEQNLFSTEPVYKELERVRLLDALKRTIDHLGGKHPVSRIINNHQPLETRVEELLSATKLFDLEYRKELYEHLDTVQTSLDPILVLAKEIDPFAREVRLQKENGLESVQNESYDAISKLCFSKYGETIYPDATFTLRLSYGSMKGYTENGQSIAPMTSISGAFERAKLFDFQEPFNLPKSWLAQQKTLKQEVPLNFVSTNDIVGGNSGSPVINKNGEIVGIIFDGNVQSLVWNFKFDDVQGRATSVHSAGILEALQNIYNADSLVKEILQVN